MTAPRVAVAASGGRDSTALLHCTVRQASGLGLEVVALHVHHGLSPHADKWAAQVRRQSRRWGAAYDQRQLRGRPAVGESVEAWARRLRYEALAEMAHQAGCSLILLAHHRRDQAETWLLQALRGGGDKALSAMPRMALHSGLAWVRPWLDQPREAIETYLRRKRLTWIEDDSNADTRFARNRLRAQVWPALLDAFADAETAIAAAATQAQHAASLAAEIAALDLPALTAESRALEVKSWLALPLGRRRNALRFWLEAETGRGPPGRLLDRLLDEIGTSATARWPLPGAQLGLHRGRLSILACDPAPPSSALPASVHGAPAETVLDLSHPGEFEVPRWRGRFAVHPALEGGAAPELLRSLVVRRRAGGERFRLAAQASARSLKKQFQARGVAAWERDGPLLFAADGRLVYVPGLGIDGGLRADPGRSQLLITWVPDPAERTEPRQPAR